QAFEETPLAAGMGEQAGEELGGIAQAFDADAQTVAARGVQSVETAAAASYASVQPLQGLGGEVGDRPLSAPGAHGIGVAAPGAGLDPGQSLEHQGGVARRIDRRHRPAVGAAAGRQQSQAQGGEVGVGRLQRGRVEDVADEDVEVAGGVGLMRQPFQLGDDGGGVLTQQGFEYGQGGAQAAQADPQLVQGLGTAHPSQQFGVGRDL